MDRAPGLSVRLKLTLSYAAFLMLAGVVLLTAGYFSLSRGVHPGVIFIVQSHGDLLRYFAPIAASVMTFLLLFGLLGGWLLAGRMLAPLTRITDATRVAAKGSLSHRIQLEGRSDEFRELADAFDTMLGRLEAHLAEQQRFAANASHELRTPLAITQTLLDVARNDPQPRQRRARRPSPRRQHPGDRPHRSIAPAQPRRPAVLHPRTRRPVPRSGGSRLRRFSRSQKSAASPSTPPATPAAALGSHALLLQLSTNLVHNAIVHNLPEEGIVWVTTSVQPKSVVLTVENTGEKLTPQLAATLAEPFLRGTKRIRTDHSGDGLGLAIVKSITQAHDGTLTLTPRAAGGLRVTVQLPAAPPRNGR